MSPLQQLLLTSTGYNAWATGELLRVCSALHPDELVHGLGASHSSIIQTFCHIYDGERVWLARLKEGINSGLPTNYAPQMSFEILTQSWPALWKAWRKYLKSAAEADLTAPLSTRLPNGAVWPHTRAEVVLHAVNHSTLHRGQIVTMLRTLGHTPPNTDFTAYAPTR